VQPAASISSAIHTVVPGVPGPDALQGDGDTLQEGLREGADGPRLMVDPGVGAQVATLIQNGELRIPLVGVASDPIVRHGCASSTRVW